MRFVFSSCLLLSAVAFGQSLTLSVMDASALSDAQVRKLHKAAVEAAKSLSAMPVVDTFDFKGPKRGCATSDLPCQRERVQKVGTAGVVALWLKGRSDGADAEAVLFLDGERLTGLRPGDLENDALDSGLKGLFEAVLPQWLRKGWGGVKLAEEPPPGSVVKVDGRVLGGKRAEVLAVPAGTHQLDLVYPDGRALLVKVDVAEGARTRLDAAPAPAVTGGATARLQSISPWRIVSYTAWMAGTATVLAALIVGFFGRQTAVGQSPCAIDNRECVTYATAQEQQRLAAGYASTANVLLAVGLTLAVGGAGLFTVDVLR